jgi:dihydropteroate synthase
MHMRGEPRTMQTAPFARNVMKDVTQGLRASIQKARKAGVAKSRIIIDPGIGFGKSFQQNYEILQCLPELAKLGHPLLVGTSRKGFLGRTLALATGSAPGKAKTAPAKERIWATAAAVTASILGGAHIVRVHDVAEMAQVARVTDCLLNPPASAPANASVRRRRKK